MRRFMRRGFRPAEPARRTPRNWVGAASGKTIRHGGEDETQTHSAILGSWRRSVRVGPYFTRGQTGAKCGPIAARPTVEKHF